MTNITILTGASNVPAPFSDIKVPKTNKHVQHQAQKNTINNKTKDLYIIHRNCFALTLKRRLDLISFLIDITLMLYV